MLRTSSPPGRMVLDADGQLVGFVLEVLHDPRTRDPRMLLVRLTPEARERLQLASPDVQVAVQRVRAFRPGEILLDRAAREAVLPQPLPAARDELPPA
jgi:hypothetical protein